MQQLGVVSRLFPMIVSGEKRSTIRWREAPIVLGPMRYVCDGDPSRSIVVDVTRCTDMPLSHAAAFLGREADWSGDVLLVGMREHYPDIEWTDLVQIIEHRLQQD